MVTSTLDRSAPMELRDRRSAAGGGGILCAPCRWLLRVCNGMSTGDKILTVVTIGLLISNAAIIVVKKPQEGGEGEGEGGEGETTNGLRAKFGKVKDLAKGKLSEAKDKWDRLFIPPTPAPTMAPTEVRVEETPEEIATKIAEFDWGVAKFEKPAECSEDVLKKVKDSGMDGSKCSGQAYSQECSTSRMARKKDNTWIEGFIDEVKELRKDGKGGGAQNATFVSALLNYDCSNLGKLLRAPTDVPEELLKWPWLCCSEPYDNAEAAKWGKMGDACTASDIDDKMISRDLREAIKDAVLAGPGDESALMFTGGMKTLARTRYVEFDYDWKGAWGGTDLKGVIDKMDAVGHTCYWAGPGKLWRATGCWLSHYGYKTWSHLACAHRVLAPKLAERMEGVFKKTIGME